MKLDSSTTGRPLAVITGASTGIGYELARKLGEEGYDLVITSSNEQKLQEAASTLRQAAGDAQIDVVVADMTKQEGVVAVYEELRKLGRPVDVLCANAGVGVYGEFAEETSIEDEIDLINLNVTSQVHLIKLVAKDMVARRSGDILITSSIAGILPGPRMAVYAASKAFLRSFGQAIRNELKEHEVNVTVLMPGPTDTEFFERADMTDTVVGQGSKQDAGEVAEAAIAALHGGDDHVVTGGKNKAQAVAAKLMTDEARAKVHGKQTQRDH